MNQSKKKLGLLLVMTFLCTLFLSFSAFAAELEGGLTSVDGSRITGWAWNKGVFDETVNVELHFYKDGQTETVKVVTLPADSYSSEVSKSIGDGYHGFDYQVNWSEMGGSSYKVEAYAVAGDAKVLLPDAKEYKLPIRAGASREAAPAAEEQKGPGVDQAAEKAQSEGSAVSADPHYKKGASLGTFTTTGYCSCRKCSGGSGKTYSGTTPRASHTISADISVLPLGSKVMIGSTVYTVEDIGSGVNGRKIDIYYGSHSDALAHGRKSQEVFAVVEE